MTLAPFVALLERHGLINLDAMPHEDKEGFENRLRLQKYVYLVRHYGLDLGYHYGIYRYGPYSSALASDYYALAEDVTRYELELGRHLPPFNVNGFFNLVSGKSTNWLEIAATLLDQKPRFNTSESLINHVESIKCDYSSEYITDVLNDLQHANLIS
jgi:uncharacterized protein YwgA